MPTPTIGPILRRSAAATASPLPAAPQTLALYLKALETQRSRSPAGLAAGRLASRCRRCAGDSPRSRAGHATAGLETPTEALVRAPTLAPLQPRSGTAVRKKEPLLIEQLPAILLAMPNDELATRDRALLLLGYAGACRRSELVALDVEQLRLWGPGATSGSQTQRMTRGRGARALRPAPAGDVDKSGALRRGGARVPARRRAARAGLSDVWFTRTAHGHTARLGRRRTDPSATDRDGGRDRRLRWAFAAAWIHYERRAEKDSDREHQAGDRAA